MNRDLSLFVGTREAWLVLGAVSTYGPVDRRQLSDLLSPLMRESEIDLVLKLLMERKLLFGMSNDRLGATWAGIQAFKRPRLRLARDISRMQYLWEEMARRRNRKQ